MTASTANDNGSITDPGFHPLASFTFWCCLFLGVLLFAAVALSPRLKTYRELEWEYAGAQQESLFLERRVDELQKVAEALEQDPEFAAEQARVDFDIAGSEERFPMDHRLNLGGAQPPRPAPVHGMFQSSLQSALSTPFLDILCDDLKVRHSLSMAASILLIVGFTFCRLAESDGTTQPTWNARCGRWLANRYGKR